MTVHEKALAIASYCELSQFSCADCPLDSSDVCYMHEEQYPAIIEENYQILRSKGLIKDKRDDDPINHPSHYCQPDSMECIDEMESVFGIEATRIFCVLNVWKYRKRAIYKNGEEDMKKADWYIKKACELERRKRNVDY